MSDFIEYIEEEMSVFTEIMRKNRVNTKSKSWSELIEIANAMNDYAKHVANDVQTSDSGLHLQRVSNSLPDFGFAEWLGRNYIRLNKVWVHRYVDQRDEKNWKTTEQLYSFWNNGGNDC